MSTRSDGYISRAWANTEDAENLIERMPSDEAASALALVAQVYATLALVEEQRTANLIAVHASRLAQGIPADELRDIIDARLTVS